LIQDDNFSRGGEWAKKVIELMHEFGFTWDNNGGWEMENLTPEFVEWMGRAWMYNIFHTLQFQNNKHAKDTRKAQKALYRGS